MAITDENKNKILNPEDNSVLSGTTVTEVNPEYTEDTLDDIELTDIDSISTFEKTKVINFISSNIRSALYASSVEEKKLYETTYVDANKTVISTSVKANKEEANLKKMPLKALDEAKDEVTHKQEIFVIKYNSSTSINSDLPIYMSDSPTSKLSELIGKTFNTFKEALTAIGVNTSQYVVTEDTNDKLIPENATTKYKPIYSYKIIQKYPEEVQKLIDSNSDNTYNDDYVLSIDAAAVEKQKEELKNNPNATQDIVVDNHLNFSDELPNDNSDSDTIVDKLNQNPYIWYLGIQVNVKYDYTKVNKTKDSIVEPNFVFNVQRPEYFNNNSHIKINDSRFNISISTSEISLDQVKTKPDINSLSNTVTLNISYLNYTCVLDLGTVNDVYSNIIDSNYLYSKNKSKITKLSDYGDDLKPDFNEYSFDLINGTNKINVKFNTTLSTVKVKPCDFIEPKIKYNDYKIVNTTSNTGEIISSNITVNSSLSKYMYEDISDFKLYTTDPKTADEATKDNVLCYKESTDDDAIEKPILQINFYVDEPTTTGVLNCGFIPIYNNISDPYWKQPMLKSTLEDGDIGTILKDDNTPFSDQPGISIDNKNNNYISTMYCETSDISEGVYNKKFSLINEINTTNYVDGKIEFQDIDLVSNKIVDIDSKSYTPVYDGIVKNKDADLMSMTHKFQPDRALSFKKIIDPTVTIEDSFFSDYITTLPYTNELTDSGRIILKSELDTNKSKSLSWIDMIIQSISVEVVRLLETELYNKPIKDLSDNVSTINTNISNLIVPYISYLKTLIDDHYTWIDQLLTQVSNDRTNMLFLYEQNVELTSKLSTLETTVGTLKTAVETLTGTSSDVTNTTTSTT